MPNDWEKQRNKREKIKRDRAQYKQSSRTGSSEPMKNSILETPPEQVGAGIISSIHKNKHEILIGHHTVEAKFAPAVFAGEEMDFAVGDSVWVTKDAVERTLVVGRK